MRHRLVKFEVSIYFNSNVIAFFWKALTKVFVNPCQCPCKTVTTVNDITSLKLNNLTQNLDKKCILTLAIDIFQIQSKKNDFSRFPYFSRWKWHFGKFRTKFLIGTHNIEYMVNIVTKYHYLSSLCKINEGSIDFPSLDTKYLIWPMIFTNIT